MLSQTIQATRNPRIVLEHLLRIGRQVIISFPNFGYWRVRTELAFRGRMPITDIMPEAWYETPNIHHCTIRDFVGLCRVLGARIEKTRVAARAASDKAAMDGSRPRLSVRNLQLGTKLHDVSFDLANGEVAGVFALEAKSYGEAEQLCDYFPSSGSGQVNVEFHVGG